MFDTSHSARCLHILMKQITLRQTPNSLIADQKTGMLRSKNQFEQRPKLRQVNVRVAINQSDNAHDAQFDG